MCSSIMAKARTARFSQIGQILAQAGQHALPKTLPKTLDEGGQKCCPKMDAKLLSISFGVQYALALLLLCARHSQY